MWLPLILLWHQNTAQSGIRHHNQATSFDGTKNQKSKTQGRHN
jgi:hypothetical protein